MKIDLDIVVGVFISIVGLLLIVYSFKNEPSKEKSESTKSSNIQLKILGAGIFISGLIYAF